MSLGKGIPILKWPRSLEDAAQLSALKKVFATDSRPLWDGGAFRVAHPQIPKAFKELMPLLHARKQLSRGLESVASILAGEKNGLDALQKKQGGTPAYRLSRLLVIGDAGSERFNRQCETLLLEHSDRLLGICLDKGSSDLMENIYGEGALAKVLLISHKEAVAQALLALL